MADDKQPAEDGDAPAPATTAAGKAGKGDQSGKMLTIAAVIVVVLAVLVIVSVTAFRSSLEKTGEPVVIGPDHIDNGITAKATVTGMDTTKKEMTVRLAMDAIGDIDDGHGLLSRPVSLYYSTFDGTKQVDFKAGKPFGTTDLAIPMEGDPNLYPWDTYTGDIEIQFVSYDPEAVKQAASSGTTTTTAKPASSGEGEGETPPTTAAPSASTTTTTAPPKLDTLVPTELIVYKNVPAYNVVNVAGDSSDDGVLDATFDVTRAPTAQFFSVLVTVIMWGLAIGVMLIAISVILRRRKLELAVISMMAVILFAMPAALRSFQPGIPPPGVLSDFYGFFWCDVIVAFSLIAMLVTFLARRIEKHDVA